MTIPMPDTFETLTTEIDQIVVDYGAEIAKVLAGFQGRIESLTQRLSEAPISENARKFLMEDLITKLQGIGS